MTRAGKSVRIGPDARAVLHALVMTEGSIRADDLESVLPERKGPNVDRHKAMKNALWKLRKDKRYRLRVSDVTAGRVTMSPEQPNATIDLWEFFELAALSRFPEAAELIAGRRRPRELEEFADHNKLWKPMLEKFDVVEEEVMAALAGASGRNRQMLDKRRLLLEHSFLPGIGGEVAIGAVRETIEQVAPPWRSLMPAEQPATDSLSAHLFELLEREDGPRRLIVCGDHGVGKTLAGIGAYLVLTDELEQAGGDQISRPVLYFDGEIEGREEGFGRNEWLKEYLSQFDSVGPRGRRIVILTHADAFFRRVERPLKEVLGWDLFREGDVMICCSDQCYLTQLQFSRYANRVIRLEPWGLEMQDRYAGARFGEEVQGAYVEWREEDESGLRAELCAVPLHLSYVLSVFADHAEMLSGLSSRWRLLDQLARVRLKAAGHAGEEGGRFNELAAVAHRFHAAAPTCATPVGFDLEELRDFIASREQDKSEERLEALVCETLLVVQPPSTSRYHFELAVWAPFFTASHLVRVLKLGDRPEPVLRAFGKSLSGEVIGLCEEILADELSLHEESIIGSLHFALLEDDETELRPAQQAIARAQVGYLLARFADQEMREELVRMIDENDLAVEQDGLVRAAIERGLKGVALRGSAEALVHRGGL